MKTKRILSLLALSLFPIAVTSFFLGMSYDFWGEFNFFFKIAIVTFSVFLGGVFYLLSYFFARDINSNI
jgi:hypothetical protein